MSCSKGSSQRATMSTPAGRPPRRCSPPRRGLQAGRDLPGHLRVAVGQQEVLATPIAAGLPAPLPVARIGPDLPCTDDPELFFAESPDDVETARALCRECPARAVCLAGALKRRER